MSIATLILGEPGAGKSTSFRNLDPDKVGLIQVLKKPLPFNCKGWAPVKKDASGKVTGNIIITDNVSKIIAAMKNTSKKIIIIDDWNLTMTNEYMRRSNEVGFSKFADIGRGAWELFNAAIDLPDDVRVYMLGHTEQNEHGQIKAKTIGKMIDQTCPVESLFTIVLRAMKINGNHIFSTKTNGSDTVKSPMGMFKEEHVDNDLSLVDKNICDFYNIS